MAPQRRAQHPSAAFELLAPPRGQGDEADRDHRPPYRHPEFNLTFAFFAGPEGNTVGLSKGVVNK
jgi:hypothetical protein